MQGRVGAVVRMLGEYRGAVIGMGFAVASSVVLGLAPSSPVFLIGLLVGVPAAVIGPVTQSLMSAQTGEGEQGQLQGSLVTLIGIANLIGPGLFTVTFAHTVNWLPGAAFFVAAAISVLAILCVAGAARQQQKPNAA
jgi:MFS transporter, DHA1 family, tetracycline resistance protein